MQIGLWLDDLYIPTEKPPYIDEWKCVKTFDEFVSFINDNYEKNKQFPVLFALSHDLCDEHCIAETKRSPVAPIFYSKFKIPTGWHVVKWLIEYAKQKELPIGRVALHGDNEKGKGNMMYELQKFKDATGDEVPVFTMNWKKKKINF